MNKDSSSVLKGDFFFSHKANEERKADLQSSKPGETMKDSLHFWVYSQFLVLTLTTNIKHKRKTDINFTSHCVN